MEPLKQELYHYGIKGMHWGIRRYQNRDGSLTPAGRLRLGLQTHINTMRDKETTYRKKLTAISKNKNADASDVKLAKYRNQSLGRRVATAAASAAANMVVSDVMTGKAQYYRNMSKADIAKRARNLAIATTTNVALNDYLAKSASKRYGDSGRKRPGVKDHLLTKEDLIQTVAGSAADIAPILYVAVSMKAAQVKRDRAKRGSDFIQENHLLEAPIADFVAYADFKVKS